MTECDQNHVLVSFNLGPWQLKCDMAIICIWVLLTCHTTGISCWKQHCHYWRGTVLHSRAVAITSVVLAGDGRLDEWQQIHQWKAQAKVTYINYVTTYQRNKWSNIMPWHTTSRRQRREKMEKISTTTTTTMMTVKQWSRAQFSCSCLQQTTGRTSIHNITNHKTHTRTQPFYCSSAICLGPPGWAGTER